MVLANEASVPWVDVRALYYPDKCIASQWSDKFPTGFYPDHLRYRNERNRRSIRWRDVTGVIHATELMEGCGVYLSISAQQALGVFGDVDRVTLCEQFILNKYPQIYTRPAVLDIVPCADRVTCLSCIGLM